MLRLWQEGPFVSPTEPALVLQVWKVLSVLKCVLQPGRQVLRGAGSASALHPPPWPKASEAGKEPWEGKGLKGAAGSCFSGSPHSAWAISACFEYKHTIYSFLVCSNWLLSACWTVSSWKICAQTR